MQAIGINLEQVHFGYGFDYDVSYARRSIRGAGDVAWTAILAMQHFAKDDKTVPLVLAEKFQTIYERVPKEYQT